MAFRTTPPIELSTLLPHLSTPNVLALDLIRLLMVYDPSARLSASSALSHDWFQSTNVPLLLPDGHPGLDGKAAYAVRVWKGVDLATILQPGVEHCTAEWERG